MNIFLTGSEGFIGRNLKSGLERAGHNVITYDISHKDIKDDSNPLLLSYPKLPKFDDIDTVIHLGAISSTTESNTPLIMKYNYYFTEMLANLCNLYNIPIQFASSASVYGNPEKDTWHEDMPLSPLTPYAWSKWACEEVLMRTTHNVQCFRYFNVYSYNREDEKHKILQGQASPHATFIDQALTDGVIKIFRNSDKFYRDFVHVSKVVNTHISMLGHEEYGIWNIGTGDPRTFRDVAEEISVLYDVSITNIVMPEHIKRNYQKYSCADTSKLEETMEKLK